MKSKAFTLLESVIVLALTRLFLLVGFKFSFQSSTQIKEEQFIQNLIGKINEKVIEGKNKQKTVRLFFDEKRVRMMVGKKTEILEYPASLYKYGAEKVYISPSGVTHPVTIPLISKKYHRAYNIIFELSFGGVYRIAKSKW